MQFPVFKFDFGTTGNQPSYYRLVLNAYYPTATVTGYYRSGRRTGCGEFLFQGVGCPDTGVDE
jgi:hypothetical protein